MSDTHFYDLKIKEIRPETPDAVTVAFDIPADLKDAFNYEHGQYLTLRFKINGKDVRRAYSLSTSPSSDKVPAITVKKVTRGLVSNHIFTLKAGDVVKVMPPQGRFTIALDPDNKKDYFLVGAGSGITPLMSIMKTILEVEPKSKVHLLYGNRNEDHIIFHKEMDDLVKKYEGQVVIEHILSQPKKEKAGGFSGLFKAAKISWEGSVGRIDAKIASNFIDNNLSGDNRPAEYFLCGPRGMMEAIESTLKKRNVDEKHIHAEWFTNASDSNGGDSPLVSSGVAVPVKVQLGGKHYEVTVGAQDTILSAMLKADIDAPYSCNAGACATCMARVKNGSVKMDNAFALDNDEIENGFILACQAHPTSEGVEVNFDI